MAGTGQDPHEAWKAFFLGAAEQWASANPGDTWPALMSSWMDAAATVKPAATENPEPPIPLVGPLQSVLEQLASPTTAPRDWLLQLTANWAQRQLGYWQVLAQVDTRGEDGAERLALYHAAVNRCAAHYADCLRAAAEQLELRVEVREQDVTTLRDYFDLWVACFEAEHAAMLQRTEFAADYAEMINSAISLQTSGEG